MIIQTKREGRKEGKLNQAKESERIETSKQNSILISKSDMSQNLNSQKNAIDQLASTLESASILDRRYRLEEPTDNWFPSVQVFQRDALIVKMRTILL